MSHHSISDRKDSRLSSDSLEHRMRITASVLSAAGQMAQAMRSQLGASGVSFKTDASDLVTRADKACDQLIKEAIALHFADEPILTEESGLVSPLKAEPATRDQGDLAFKWKEITDLESVWVADPIDGTTNYVHGIEHYAICLAWLHKGEVLVAGMALPVSGELLIAAKGKGCYCNGQRIHVSQTDKLSHSVIGTGLGISGRGKRQRHLDEIGVLVDQTRGLRHLGSAACSLAKVAQSQFDGFWIRDVKPWDVASGILLVQEAGGLIEPIERGTSALETGSLIATNGHLMGKLLELIHP